MTLSDHARTDEPIPGNPFDLKDVASYTRWRERRLQYRAARPADLLVPVANPAHLSRSELEAITACCRHNNLALYETRATVGKEDLLALGHQLGLQRIDGNLCADKDNISALQVSDQGRKPGYIPYTNKPLSWHTDGYYNTPDRQIRAFVLHCVAPAVSGGESCLMDHELAYILLRDENPAWIEALMAPDAMTIPPNVENGVEIRGAETGPVFSFHEASQSLHMRYSARTRNIAWKADTATAEAVEFLRLLWEQESPYIYRHKLRAGQGVISNNVLHCRTGFADDSGSGPTRLLYRARYYDRVQNTGLL